MGNLLLGKEAITVNKKDKWIVGIGLTISHILVVTAAVFLTLLLTQRSETKLQQLENILDEQFIGEFDKTAAEDAAAGAMVAAIDDRWSYYISAEDFAEFMENKENSYVGVGITIQKEENGFPIRQVEPEGPAKEAGIRPGDLLVGVDGRNVTELDMQELKKLIQGQVDTQVSLEVMREGQKKSFSVMRKSIAVTVASGEMVSEDVGLVTIKNFNTNCAKETKEAIETLLAQGAKSLIFDVRNNGGGFVSEMVEILDYLLPEGELFRSVDYAGEETLEMSDEKCLDIPMVVLLNENSYSAAEFFGAVIREYQWGKLVGMPTTGKSHFQYTLTLNDGSAVNLSVGKYVTPKGVNLTEAKGLVPDVQVPVDEETAAYIYSHLLEKEDDPQLQAALRALKEP